MSYIPIKQVRDAVQMALSYFETQEIYGVWTEKGRTYILEGLDSAKNILEKKGQTELSWPENLVQAIFLYKIEDPITDDQMRGLEEAIKHLNDHETEAVYRHFRDDQSFEEIGKAFGITRERVRQIVAKALRKLRNPVRRRWIEKGYSVVSGELREKVKEARQHELDEADAEIDGALKKKYELLEEIQSTSVEYLSDFVVHRAAEKTFLDELELSVRSYNGLRRAGFKNVKDILEAGPEQLIGLRNIGERSYVEICNTLRAYGFTMWANGEEIKENGGLEVEE